MPRRKVERSESEERMFKEEQRLRRNHQQRQRRAAAARGTTAPANPPDPSHSQNSNLNKSSSMIGSKRMSTVVGPLVTKIRIVDGESSAQTSMSNQNLKAAEAMSPGISRQMRLVNFKSQEETVTMEQILGSKFESHCEMAQLCPAAITSCQLAESQLPDMEHEQEHIDQQSLVFGLLKLIAESELKIGLLSPFYWNDYCRRAEDNPAKYLIVKPPIDHDDHVFLLIPILFSRHFTVVIIEKPSDTAEGKEHFIDSLNGSMPKEVKKLIDEIFVRLFGPWTGLSLTAKTVENTIRQGDQQTDSWNCAAYVVGNARDFFANINEHDHGVYLKKTGQSGESKRLELYGMLAQMFELFAEDRQAMEFEESQLSEREQRLQRMREFTAQQRSRESEQQKAERLAGQKARQQTARVAETEQERAERLAQQQDRQQTTRVAETEREKAARLAKNKLEQQKTREKAKQKHLQLNIAANSVGVKTHRLGPMNFECECGALHFQEEKVQSKSTFNDCCNHGKISLLELPELPKELHELFTDTHPMSKEFFNNIRRYNAANSFAAFHANMQSFKTRGPYCYTIQGQIYYEVDQNVTANSVEPYGQLFFSDPAEAVAKRLNTSTGTKKELMELLDKIMRDHNPHANLYIQMAKMMKTQEDQGCPVEDVTMAFKMRPGYDPKRFNEPTVDEIGAVFSADANGEIPEMSLVIQQLGEPSPRVISSLSPMATAWLYPLFFPKGSLGWSVEMQKQNANKHTRVSRAQFISYRLAVRRGNFNPIHYGKKLSQQYVVDSYVQIETDRMKWLRDNQKKLKTMNYHELHASLNRLGQAAGRDIGRICVLPSSHFGSPRFMRENYQDAMAIVLKNGKPDLFVTMTCNPIWPEITETLKEITVAGVKQTASDRPDIVARVFGLKVDALLDELTKKQIFGELKCFVYVTEFQKRGLPHIHLLLSLKDGKKFLQPEIIDQFFSAELPNKTEDSELTEKVAKFMIHRICGEGNPTAPCMIKGKCRHKYPRQFLKETKVNEHGYPFLKRRNTGESIEVNKVNYDNRRVVPYSPYLLKRFDSHINVEIVSSIKNVKYLYKYAYKGHDAASLEFQSAGNINHDEIKDHIDARYVGPVEAAYRIFKLKMHNKSHHVERLPVHLEHDHSITVDAESTGEQIEAAMSKETKLMDFFSLNSRDSSARQLLYSDVPSKYTWSRSESTNAQGNTTSTHRWETRKGKFNVTGRMYAISPSQGDLWHLRLLLQHVKGATSFKELRTVNGIEHPSNGEACLALGLIEDDEEYVKCMEEAIKVLMPKKLRTLFANILLFCNPAAPELLWEQFKDDLSEDFNRHLKNTTKAQAKAYKRIDFLLRRENRSIRDFPSMEQIEELDESEEPIDHDHELQVGQEMYETLNAEQESVVTKVLNALDNGGNQKCFFVDGLGGSGKTYVYKTLCHLINGRQKKVMTCAFTGIAALLLPNGRTCHKTFGLGVPLDRDSNSNLTATSRSGKLLKEANVIIWDEAPMAPRYALEIADRKLKELTNTTELFGGKIVILGGDFRQILPILKYGTVSETINLSICSSILWSSFEQVKLHKNMRTKPEEMEFAEFLKKIGEGELNNENEEVLLPKKCLIDGELEVEIFGQLIRDKKFDEMGNSAILVSKHIGVNESNKKILSMLEGESKSYLSIDSALDAENCPDQTLLLPEYLNDIEEGALPPHNLELKKNSIVILLRNLSQEDGLCNGTRMLVVGLNEHSIECTILTGEHSGESHFIPRINNTIDYRGMFQLNRKQFPLKLAFAMTINKSQGQTFERVGLNLEHSVFEHGQLYVALSRARSWDSIRVFIPLSSSTQPGGQMVKNIVHREVFERI